MPRSASRSSTSRKLRLNTWYGQTAWLMIWAGKRCRLCGSGGDFMLPVSLVPNGLTRHGYRDNADGNAVVSGPGVGLTRIWTWTENTLPPSLMGCYGTKPKSTILYWLEGTQGVDDI